MNAEVIEQIFKTEGAEKLAQIFDDINGHSEPSTTVVLVSFEHVLDWVTEKSTLREMLIDYATNKVKKFTPRIPFFEAWVEIGRANYFIYLTW